MRADLHIHTTASDGSWTVDRLIDEVQLAGIGLFAVTDHDSVANVAIARERANQAGLSFIPGVEICSTLRGQTFHILGYGIDENSGSLLRLLQHNTEQMEEIDRSSIKKLIADGFDIDYGEYCSYRHNPARGGWKSLSFLIDKGFCQDIHEFFANLFTTERGICFPEFPEPAAVIEVIRSSGGEPVLAHPGSDFHGPALEETLDYFAHEQIAGIECYHPGHDAEVTRRALKWCDKYDLLVTGGSDCHGEFVPQRRLGAPAIEVSALRLGRLLPR